MSRKSDSVKESFYGEISLLRERFKQSDLYRTSWSGAEWGSAAIILAMSLEEFETGGDEILLLLSVCISRALYRCVIYCHSDV